MAELIKNLNNKTYEEQLEALQVLSSDNDDIGFIDIDGSAYVIPRKVLQLIDTLYTENEKLKSKSDGL